MFDDTNPNLTAEASESANEVQSEQKESQILRLQGAEEAIQQQPEQAKESSEARNFRALREKSERLQRERDEALLRLKSYDESQKSEQDTLNLGPDDLAEGKHISKMDKKINEIRRGFQQELQEIKLRSQYPDVDKVVSPENLELLKQQEPELAAAIGASPDFYAKAAAAYRAIKRMGIYQDPTPFESDRALVQKNAAKPKSLASLSPQQGDSPLSNANAFANGLTPELQKQLRREMEEAMKNR